MTCSGRSRSAAGDADPFQTQRRRGPGTAHFRRMLVWPMLLSSLFSAALVIAEPPTWEVRELSLQSPARIHLVGAWFVLGSDKAELERALALCKQAGVSECSAAQFVAETPARRVYVRSFEIDRLEVSNADYRRCVREGRCLPARPSAATIPRLQQPVVQVTWREARDYCRFMGGDLPSEAQWEYAAHGDSSRTFPWGDSLRDAAELASYLHAGSASTPDDVTSHPKGKSFFGLLNSAGNVWELVLDRYVAPYSSATHSVDPVQLEQGSERVLRGGSFLSSAHALRTRARAAIAENEARPDVGFRCAYSTGRTGS
jgi:sulfatase modifying factor 1